MSPDANVVKDLMKTNLLGVFSERDAEKRRSLPSFGMRREFSSTQRAVTSDIQQSTMPQSNCSEVFRF